MKLFDLHHLLDEEDPPISRYTEIHQGMPLPQNINRHVWNFF